MEHNNSENVIVFDESATIDLPTIILAITPNKVWCVAKKLNTGQNKEMLQNMLLNIQQPKSTTTNLSFTQAAEKGHR